MWLSREVVAVDNGDTVHVEVRVLRQPRDRGRSTVTLDVTSESDASATTSATCDLTVGDTRPRR